MGSPELVIVDYGAGNLRSVQKAFEHLGYAASITIDPNQVLRASGVVFPGQGASPPAMDALRRRGLEEALREVIGRGTPFFGVCLGLQLLMERSEEGETPCLGVVEGQVRRLTGELKVPHMGWNQVYLRHDHLVFRGVPQGSNFYFVHSYYADPKDDAVVLGTTRYGVEFCSVAARDNIIATQFHPEKSGPPGLKLYDNFVKFMVGKGRRHWK